MSRDEERWPVVEFMHESIVFCSTCTMSSYKKFTFAISMLMSFLHYLLYSTNEISVGNVLMKYCHRSLKGWNYKNGCTIVSKAVTRNLFQGWVFSHSFRPSPSFPFPSNPSLFLSRSPFLKSSYGIWSSAVSSPQRGDTRSLGSKYTKNAFAAEHRLQMSYYFC